MLSQRQGSERKGPLNSFSLFQTNKIILLHLDVQPYGGTGCPEARNWFDYTAAASIAGGALCLTNIQIGIFSLMIHSPGLTWGRCITSLERVFPDGVHADIFIGTHVMMRNSIMTSLEGFKAVLVYLQTGCTVH